MNFQTTILHLDYDVLKAILLLVVASAGGATDLARIMAVCKEFAMLGDNKDILKMANFKNFSLLDSIKDWLHIKSLLIRCAEAGNTGAQYILAKVILLGYSQLLDQESSYKQLCTRSYTNQASFSRAVERYVLFSFLSYLTPDQATDNNSIRRKLTHFELVSLFMRRCSITEHVSMLPHMQNYVAHFGFGNKGGMKFFYCFYCMTGFLRAIVDVGRERRTRYSPRLLNNCQIEPEMRNALDVLRSVQMKYSYYFRSSTRVLSRPKWEELKRECQFIEEELLSFESCTKPFYENYKILICEKGFSTTFAFSGPITREIDVPLDRDMANLQAESITDAEIYISWQQKAASAFDEMFLPNREV